MLKEALLGIALALAGWAFVYCLFSL